ncbi:peroxiredoxin family protein [Halorussus caseinilyticus]|uniref:peroxiredoxin family protein n=1 Tax=Halorussus caseinilyticus TaxID=3034025 RepID=UPI003075B998
MKGGSEEADAERRTGDPGVPDRLGVSDLDFELPNAGVGPDPLRLADLAADPKNDALVVLFQRDYHSRACRQQVKAVADRYREFRDRSAAVVSVLPESKGKARKFQKKFHLPYALVADAEKTASEQYGQPTRLGGLGARIDLVGRMPETAVLDARGGDLRLHAVHRGDSPSDHPSVDDVLAMVDRALEWESD